MLTLHSASFSSPTSPRLLRLRSQAAWYVYSYSQLFHFTGLDASLTFSHAPLNSHQTFPPVPRAQNLHRFLPALPARSLQQTWVSFDWLNESTLAFILSMPPTHLLTYDLNCDLIFFVLAKQSRVQSLQVLHHLRCVAVLHFSYDMIARPVLNLNAHVVSPTLLLLHSRRRFLRNLLQAYLVRCLPMWYVFFLFCKVILSLGRCSIHPHVFHWNHTTNSLCNTSHHCRLRNLPVPYLLAIQAALYVLYTPYLISWCCLFEDEYVVRDEPRLVLVLL